MDIISLQNQLSETRASLQELSRLSYNSNFDLSVHALVCSRELGALITELEDL